MSKIHPTAIIDEKAKIGNNVEIGPYAYIQGDVEIGNDCMIGPSACVYDGARIGNNVKIFQGASVSNLPQDLKFEPDFKSYFYIDDNTTIREFVTLHRGTEDKVESRIGKNCLLMAYAHVAHDCYIGDNCILANSVQVGGHATLEDWVIIGGATPIHQFIKIGQHAMVGGGYRVIADVPPFVLTSGEPLRYAGLNIIGLRRRGFDNETIFRLKDAYKLLFLSGKNLSEGKKDVIEKYGKDEYVNKIITFLEKSTRGIIKR